MSTRDQTIEETILAPTNPSVLTLLAKVRLDSSAYAQLGSIPLELA